MSIPTNYQNMKYEKEKLDPHCTPIFLLEV